MLRRGFVCDVIIGLYGLFTNLIIYLNSIHGAGFGLDIGDTSNEMKHNSLHGGTDKLNCFFGVKLLLFPLLFGCYSKYQFKCITL